MNIVPFSIPKHLSLILQWYPDSKSEEVRNTVLDACLGYAKFGFCYFEENVCLANFALHVNKDLGLGIVNYVTLSPTVKQEDKNKVLFSILEHVKSFFLENTLDSFEIYSTTVPKEFFQLDKTLISSSVTLERKVKADV